MPVSDEVLRDGIRLSEAATERPWKPFTTDRYRDGTSTSGIMADGGGIVFSANERYFGSHHGKLADREYITFIANHFPAIAAELLALRERVKELENYCEHCGYERNSP